MVQPKYALYIFITMTLCVDTRAILNCHIPHFDDSDVSIEIRRLYRF